MAEGKKSFVLYSDQRNVIDLLSDEQAGRLLKHIFSYVNDEKPVLDDLPLQLAFEPIKQQLKRDLDKWDEIKEKRSRAGKRSAELRKQNKQKPTSVESVEQTSTNSTVNGNVNDNVTVNVNESVIHKEEPSPASFPNHKPKNLENVITCTRTIKKRENHNDYDCEEVAKKFYRHYGGVGWRIGSNLITDWILVLEKWLKQESDNTKPKPSKSSGAFY